MVTRSAFRCLARGLPVQSLLGAVAAHPELWNRCRVRTGFTGSPQAQADDIILRFQAVPPVLDSQTIRSLMDGIELTNWEAWDILCPHVWPLAATVVGLTEASGVGRVVLTRLPPGGHILPHCDEGGYADAVARCHVVLAGTSRFRAGTEDVFMQPGECWWFDTSLEHEVWTVGPAPRLTLIVDVQTPLGGRYVA